MTIQEARKLAKEKLSSKRYKHTEGVAAAARKLAPKFGADPDKAELAGLLHDILKEEKDDVLLGYMKGSSYMEDPYIMQKHSVWHSYAGGIYVRRELGVPEDVASAIAAHTTGKPDMTPLEKTVFLADYISEERTYDDCVRVRKIAEKDPERAVLEELRLTVISILEKEKIIDDVSVAAYNYYQNKARQD